MSAPNGPAGAYAAIVRFLERGRAPALLEPGEAEYRLLPGSYTLEWRNGRLTIQVWDERRNLARRIVGLGEESSGKLELTIERFGKRQGCIYLLDGTRGGAEGQRRGARLVFREQFRRSLSRQFPGWQIAELSSEANLEESLSPAFPRALLTSGATGLAALAAPPEPGAAASALTFALIWLDYLRRRERRLGVENLAVFYPEREARPACQRIRFLNHRAVRVQAFVYTEEGYEERLDAGDWGNLETRLETRASLGGAMAPQVAAWVERLGGLPHVETVERADGSASLRVRGMEFARATRSELLFGLETKAAAREGNLEEIEQLAREIARMRAPTAEDRENPIYRGHPEAWLESEVRAHPERIDATLVADPIYGQVPAVAGGERGILDLLAVDRAGRLAVLELKASEDIHLPLQALDYWMRVVWHLERGEFGERGYFPGIALRRDWPRLLLVAPSLGFHPKTETILRYFARTIEVERIGVGVEWRQGPRVMFRIPGAQRPL
jgi:hypothetical protein